MNEIKAIYDFMLEPPAPPQQDVTEIIASAKRAEQRRRTRIASVTASLCVVLASAGWVGAGLITRPPSQSPMTSNSGAATSAASNALEPTLLDVVTAQVRSLRSGQVQATPEPSLTELTEPGTRIFASAAVSFRDATGGDVTVIALRYRGTTMSTEPTCQKLEIAVTSFCFLVGPDGRSLAVLQRASGDGPRQLAATLILPTGYLRVVVRPGPGSKLPDRDLQSILFSIITDHRLAEA